MVRHSSRIELSQKALKTNFNFLRKKIGKDIKISSVVKANAYGHGIHQFVPMAEKCGINHFSVASSFEAEEVLDVCREDTNIMIMGILYDSDLPWVIKHGIEFYVFHQDRLKASLDQAHKLGMKAKIHLEVETGANRTGIHNDDFKDALQFMKDHSEDLEFKGLCTHLGGAESFANKFKIDKQKKRFEEFVKQCDKMNYKPESLHVASSAGSLSYPDTRYDMVRVGVAQYGHWPSPEIYYDHLNTENKTSDNTLKRVFTWKTDIMDVRKVEAGEFVGYGTAFQATHDMTIAVMPLGYSNGYPKALSNRGKVLIHGKKCPIVGLINMNLFMVDVTHLENPQIGDEVVLVGRQKNNTIKLASFTEFTNLLNNEMLSRLPQVIPREVVS
jgi:alanine racemase